MLAVVLHLGERSRDLDLGERSRDLDLEVRWLLRGPPTRRSAELLERWEIAICACRDLGFPLRSLECGLKLEAGEQSCLRLHLHADGTRREDWQVGAHLHGQVGGGRRGEHVHGQVGGGQPTIGRETSAVLGGRRGEHVHGQVGGGQPTIGRETSAVLGGQPTTGAGAAVSAAATSAAVSAAASSAAVSAALALAFLLTHVRYGHSAALAVSLTPVQGAMLRDQPPMVRALGAQSGALVVVLSAARGEDEGSATEEPAAEPSQNACAHHGATEEPAAEPSQHGALLLLCGCRPALRKARELVAAWNESTPTDPTVVGGPRASCWAVWNESTPTDAPQQEQPPRVSRGLDSRSVSQCG